MACGVGSAYLNVPCQERIWFEADIQNGPAKIGKIMVMVRYLYGLKSSGAARRKLSAEKWRNMDSVPMVADTDVYQRQARKPNGED